MTARVRNGWRGLGLVGLVALFAALRFATCFNDLWLDEIWSLDNALALNQPLEILTRLHIDNNHPLYTLWLWALGDRQPAWVYRFPAWLAGLATLVLAGLVAAHEQHRSQRPEVASSAVWFATLLIGGSYLLLHYASEARGYSAAVAFSLLAYYSVLRGADQRRSRWAPLFWIAITLALLGHATAVHTFVAAVLWTTVRWSSTRRNWADVFHRMLWWHCAPLAFATVYWWIFLRHLAIGGGPLRSLVEQLAAACAYALGLPVSLAYLSLPVAAALAAAALIRLRNGVNDRWIFYAVAVFLSPAAMLAMTRHELIFERYFLVNLAFLLLLASSFLAAAWPYGGWRRLAAALTVATFLVGNAVHTRRLLRLGRGDYRAALSYIAGHSPEQEITLGSDHDFRNGTVINYHVRRLSSAKTLRYLATSEWPAGGPHWLVLHRQTETNLPSTDLTDRGGNLYHLEQSYAHAAMSGWNWFLLRNTSRPPLTKD